MTKQEQKTIIDTIETIFNEKISKLSTELENEKKNRILLTNHRTPVTLVMG